MTNDNSSSMLIPFTEFLRVFGLYKIETDQSFKVNFNNSSDDGDSGSSTSGGDMQTSQSFPFLNLYYVLSLLKELTMKKQLSLEEIKHSILFVIILMMDPCFVGISEPEDQDNSVKQQPVLPTRGKKPLLKQETQSDNVNSVDDAKHKSTVFKIVLLLNPLLDSLCHAFFDKVDMESANTELFSLFQSVWQSLKDEHRMALCNKVSYALPAVPIRPGIDLQRRFALFSIGKLLKASDESIEQMIVQPNMIEEMVKLVMPYVQQIRDETLDVLLVLNLVTLVDITSNDRAELNRLKTAEKRLNFQHMIRTWKAKIKESPKDFNFDKSRIKDGLVLIESKLAALIKDHSSSSIMDYFSTME
ncbi:hypothetical protein SAMD00019534_119870 [Acytostelium subglobosum LB1]|uniref:hypothetical protein n=1 Tax=Acytostelium subglobosum LB1 TaxID=1410327 RepID=UPI000644EF77|nr:hypothetical protein SAMD00019534_119870 [Acytostelium subglobosum LB1]GAM28811.1 hypothetical protein SAMD00019534_119870 [Acytostelium subglobosum LB1]|eukprot:XP_012748183.1 hypothetical protein SAMD00019534_119870 [Acytostelium subglobosum LB1]